MTDREMRKLGRAELLEMLIAQTEENQRLKARLAEADAEVANRRLTIEQAGTLAEASLGLSQIFSDADAAAALYLENIRTMEMQQKEFCEKAEAQCRETCEKLELQCRVTCEKLENECRENCEKKKAECSRLCEEMLEKAEEECQKKHQELDTHCLSLSQRLGKLYKDYQELCELQKISSGGEDS